MTPDMELALAARAENIAIVRHALGGFGEAFGLSEEKLSDIRLAVTEACANVVMHAYPEDVHGQPAAEAGSRKPGWGTMEISATMLGEEMTVTVRDWGHGIRPRPDSPGLGLGLSLIAALAETVQLGHDTREHTEVRMTFLLSGERPGADAGEARGPVRTTDGEELGPRAAGTGEAGPRAAPDVTAAALAPALGDLELRESDGRG